MITKEKIWTYQDYLELNDDKRYELIEGALIEMAPSPRPKHQQILTSLNALLWMYVKERRMGTVYVSPIDTVFDEINTFQPDLVFISKEKNDIIQEKNISGTPDLVIEILSPSTAHKDRDTKYKIYQKNKVKEYWIIDPEEHVIEVFTLEQDKLISYCNVKNKDKVNSKVFTELDICFEDLIV